MPSLRPCTTLALPRRSIPGWTQQGCNNTGQQKPCSFGWEHFRELSPVVEKKTTFFFVFPVSNLEMVEEKSYVCNMKRLFVMLVKILAAFFLRSCRWIGIGNVWTCIGFKLQKRHSLWIFLLLQKDFHISSLVSQPAASQGPISGALWTWASWLLRQKRLRYWTRPSAGMRKWKGSNGLHLGEWKVCGKVRDTAVSLLVEGKSASAKLVS